MKSLEIEMLQYNDLSYSNYSVSRYYLSTISSVYLSVNQDGLNNNKIWNGLDSEKKKFWYNREIILNKEPLKGQLLDIPTVLLLDRKLSIMDYLNYLSDDWRRFMKMIKF